MTSLIACIGHEGPAWEYVQKLILGASWEQVFLVCSEEGKSRFASQRQVHFITVDSKQPLIILVDEVRKALDGKIADTDVAVNMALGTGKEHMALLSALLKLGLGIRLVAYTLDGVKEV
ncbi:hypothetical protein HYY74_05560 [Candidatus Woesearchaeota archaeon]|nr:hypothetical protein [Candidatus Woesearchaeota archaeon]